MKLNFCLGCYRLHSIKYRNIFRFRWRITKDFWFCNNLKNGGFSIFTSLIENAKTPGPFESLFGSFLSKPIHSEKAGEIAWRKVSANLRPLSRGGCPNRPRSRTDHVTDLNGTDCLILRIEMHLDLYKSGILESVFDKISCIFIFRLL